MNLSHINEKNHPTMVDVSLKNETKRVAIATGKITMSAQAYQAVIENTAHKGPVLQTAIIAAIMGAKKTSDLIPMCHPLFISGVNVMVDQDNENYTFILKSIVKTEGKTGVEMEALMSVSIGLLTIYDMVKAIDKGMVITEVRLESKSGGKSGDYYFNA